MGLLETGGNFYVSTRLGGVAGFIAVFLLLIIRPRGLQGSGRDVEVRRV
jgi:hypothetical protein